MLTCGIIKQDEAGIFSHCVQLKSGDSYLYATQSDDAEIFTIKNPRHADYWQKHAYPVMLVIRTSDGAIRWMEVSAYLKKREEAGPPDCLCG
jgi:Domain of unknown function (DUF4365)